MSLTSASSLGEIEWIPRPRSTQLRRLGLETVGDLLTHYPRRYEDRREFAGFPREESEVPVCLCGEVVKTRLNRFGRRKIFEATLQEDAAHALSQPLTLRWFNLHYVQKMILTGQRLVVFGKPRLRGQRLCMEHPEFEVIENDEEISIHFRRITPIYPATEGLSQRVLRGLIYRLLEEWEDDGTQTLLPAGVEARPLVAGAAGNPFSFVGRRPRARPGNDRVGGIFRDADAAFLASLAFPGAERCDSLRIGRVAGALSPRAAL